MSRTLSDLKFITPPTLKTWLTESKRRIAVVDVRDDDYLGGHIRGCLHFPSSTLREHLTELRQIVKERQVQQLVFHCMLSQARGPKAALLFLRALDDLPENEKGDEPEVYVLKGGFTNWASHYGSDSAVTEGYVPSLWD